jgi:hypothetical protein
MYRFVLIVLLTMVNATIAVHLGLSAAIGKVLTKVLSCPKCLTFWCSLVLLIMFGCNIFIAVVLSLLGAYTSSWFALLLVKLNQKYNELWQNLNDK